MASCIKCGNKKLEWLKDRGRFRLYETTTGNWHDTNCVMTVEEYKQLKGVIENDNVCKHGILKDRTCPQCDMESHRG